MQDKQATMMNSICQNNCLLFYRHLEDTLSPTHQKSYNAIRITHSAVSCDTTQEGSTSGVQVAKKAKKKMAVPKTRCSKVPHAGN